MTTDDDEKSIDDETQSDEVGPEDEERSAEVLAWESEEFSPEARVQFWMSVAAYEQAPSTTHFQLLGESGIELPAPESMNDQRLATKLWEVIKGLARLRVFLSQTDHMSDRELYESLWRDVLREAIKDLPLGAASAWHIDLAGSGSAEDTNLYLKYYAGEDIRRQWVADFPDDEMPDHEKPPFDRDRHLPQANNEAQTNVEDGEVM
jgi:hypothetical protein